MTDNWTANNIPDLTGKVVVVTGANSGIGFEAAKEFARNGAHTILACRNMEKADNAIQDINTEIPKAVVQAIQLDLSSLTSIRKFAETYHTEFDHLDVLLNNAGIMMVPYGKTEDGFERQFGTNHLGHFALTGLLIDLLSNTPGSRVVNVSSIGHTSGIMDFDNLMFESGKAYEPMTAYGRSKLANLLFTYELQRRFDAMGASTMALAAHPGLSNTALGDHWGIVKLLRPLFGLLLQSSAMGALPSLRAAVDPKAKGGAFYGPAGNGQRRGYPVVVQSNRASHNLENAERLWQVSEELTGVHYL
ncbi:MAG TPA: oxidoreductase [Anaerolineales bacterium]|nr:oxidoreductase [Anaerolineales bacterium]